MIYSFPPYCKYQFVEDQWISLYFT